MDTISRLVRLAHLEGTLDTRCLFTGRTVVVTQLFPRVRRRSTWCWKANALSSSRTEPSSSSPATSCCSLADKLTPSAAELVQSPGILRQNGAAFTTARASGSGDLLDLFCGHYTFRPGAGGILFATLPDVVHVNLGPQASEHVRALTALMRDEADNEGHGTAVILSSLCDVLLTMVLRHSPQRRPTDRAPWTAIDDMRMQTAIECGGPSTRPRMDYR